MAAVGVFGIQPSEFWRMTPNEFWWLVESKIPPEKITKPDSWQEIRDFLNE